ncbi:MAG TPA: PAS domain S-box protein, partial [Isosphaeraceae bacterium]
MEPVLEQRDELLLTLSCIGDAVLTADALGRVTFLNPVAEALTGWTRDEAAGLPLENIVRLISAESRQAVESPTVRTLREGVVVTLGDHTLLIAKDGTEWPIDDTSAPIRNARGEVVGVVLVFRDVSERRRHERAAREALDHAGEIIESLREPFVVLDENLTIKTANASFYRTFHACRGETEGRFIHDLGNGQWDIPRLRELLGETIPRTISVQDFEVEHDFPVLGRRSMLLNARRFPPEGDHPNLVLLAIEDVTDRRRSDAAVQDSELRYRRLFQAAKDGILILDAETGTVIDVNAFLCDLLGYEPDALLGKQLWEIGLFRDIEANQEVSRNLLAEGYVRYDHLPLKARDGREVEVEFVSNVYMEGRQRVAQCNVRDITERSRLERQTRDQAAALTDLHRRKDEFLAMLSHELRNPLASILNAVQMLHLHADDEPIQQQAQAILDRQVGQLVHHVDDLLDVSRITTGKVSLQLVRCEAR